MKPLILDFETRSQIDLTRQGATVYVRDPSTYVICLGYQWEDKTYVATGAGNGRTRTRKLRMPTRVREAINDPETVLVAHNALFERAIWKYVLDWPDVPAHRWYCTSNVAGLYNLPQALDQLTAYMWPKDVDSHKDSRGKQLIQLLSKPQKDGTFREDRDLLQEMYAYCAQDIKITAKLYRALPKPPRVELRIQIADVHANERGYQVDRDFCKKAIAIDSALQRAVTTTCRDLTGFKPTQTAKLQAWLADHGCPLPDMKRQTIEGRLVDMAPGLIRTVLELRVAGARGSTQKFEGLLRQSTDAFPRITHHTNYAAGNTARWIARGVQIHNFRSRNLISYDLPGIKREVMTDTLPRNVDIRNYIGGAVRASIIAAPGKILALGDYSGMENRMLMYLAGEERQLQLIRDGLDVYRDLATRVFGIPNPDDIDPWQRQICKHMVLGLGFGMGALAFFVNLKFKFQVDLVYDICRAIVGPSLDSDTQVYIDRLRDSKRLYDYITQQVCLDGGKLNRKIVQGLVTTTHLVRLFRGDFDALSQWWRLLNTSFRELMDSVVGASVEIPRACTMHRQKTSIVFELPSGRPMYYWKPRFRGTVDPITGENTTELVYEQATGRRMKLLKGYGARMGANLVQGISRDIMAIAFADLDDAFGWDPIVTVHDEIISETEDVLPHKELQTAYERSIMASAKAHSWSTAIPLKVDVDISPCWLSKG